MQLLGRVLFNQSQRQRPLPLDPPPTNMWSKYFIISGPPQNRLKLRSEQDIIIIIWSGGPILIDIWSHGICDRPLHRLLFIYVVPRAYILPWLYTGLCSLLRLARRDCGVYELLAMSAFPVQEVRFKVKHSLNCINGHQLPPFTPPPSGRYSHCCMSDQEATAEFMVVGPRLY